MRGAAWVSAAARSGAVTRPDVSQPSVRWLPARAILPSAVYSNSPPSTAAGAETNQASATHHAAHRNARFIGVTPPSGQRDSGKDLFDLLDQGGELRGRLIGLVELLQSFAEFGLLAGPGRVGLAAPVGLMDPGVEVPPPGILAPGDAGLPGGGGLPEHGGLLLVAGEPGLELGQVSPVFLALPQVDVARRVLL